MKIVRAKEIVESHGVINVVYKNKPIWIEYLQEDEKTAMVKDMIDNVVYEVNIEELKEE